MKKRYILCTVALLVALAAIAFLVWYFSPKPFLRDITPDTVARISVFNGSTGKRMQIDDPESIRTIVEDIQATSFVRDGISSNIDGFGFSLTFEDKNGNVIDSFILNSGDTVRDDPFFYRAQTKMPCYDHLKQLEEALP